MRILFAHTLFGDFAGAEGNVRQTASGLSARGHRIGILFESGSGKGEDHWRDIFKESSFLCAPRCPAESVRRAVSQFQPDLIYLHKTSNLGLIQALLDSQTPVVRMVHDHELYCMKGSKYGTLARNPCRRSFGPLCLFPCMGFLRQNDATQRFHPWRQYRNKLEELRLNRRCVRLIVATRFMRMELERNGFDGARIEVAPPTPKMKMNTATSQEAAGKRRHDRILYTGQIIRGKGVDLLIRSLAFVQAPFECHILGDGRHRGHCERLRDRMGLGSRVRFEGYLDPAELSAHYQRAGLSVMSSVWPEPFGAAGLEAFAHRLPVVAFDAGGISEWLIHEENGLLAPPKDCRAMGAAIERLIKNPNLAKRLGERGYRMMREQFNFSSYLQRLEQIFLDSSVRNSMN